MRLSLSRMFLFQVSRHQKIILIIFLGFASASAISITKSTLSGTAVSGYDTILKSIKVNANTLTQSVIEVNSDITKIQIDDFVFTSNTASTNYPSIKLSALSSAIIENSRFTNNIGNGVQDIYLNEIKSTSGMNSFYCSTKHD